MEEMAAQLKEWRVVAATTAASAVGRATDRRWTHKGCGRGEWCPARIASTTPSGSQRTQPGSTREAQTLKSTMEAGLPDPQAPPLDMSTRTSPACCRGGADTFAAELESTGAPSSLRADATEKAGYRRERREPRWEFEELSRALTKVLRHHPIVLMMEDNPALLEDVVQALQHPDLGWEGLGVKEVVETVRRSHRDGRTRSQILRGAQERRWIRATSGHTFRHTGYRADAELDLSCACQALQER